MFSGYRICNNASVSKVLLNVVGRYPSCVFAEIMRKPLKCQGRHRRLMGGDEDVTSPTSSPTGISNVNGTHSHLLPGCWFLISIMYINRFRVSVFLLSINSAYRLIFSVSIKINPYFLLY